MMDPVYPNAELLRENCEIGHHSAVFYKRPGRKAHEHAFAAQVGGMTLDQSYSNYLIKNRTPGDDDRWWAFVFLLCRVFAESAQGECFLISRVPYKRARRSIWAREEFPALAQNSKVKKVTCVDVYNNSERKVLLDRSGGSKGKGKAGAKAVATELNSTFFSLSSSDLVSMWMGKRERLIKQLFNMARKNKPSIVFIDEVYALCEPRGEGESEASRRIKSELLVQMDGVGRDSTGVLIPAATNIPWQLDAAIRGRMHINPSGLRERIEMFKMSIGTTPYAVSHADPEELGKMIEGYSGSDITIAVQDALRQPVRKIQTSEHYKKVIVEGVEKLRRGSIAFNYNIHKGHGHSSQPTPASHGNQGLDILMFRNGWCKSFLQLRAVRLVLRK